MHVNKSKDSLGQVKISEDFYYLMQSILDQFIVGIRSTSILEYIAVFTGIASVWYSKKENILVYPVGLINTIIYIYLSIKQHLYGEATVNLYYTIMSVYGWMIWAKRNEQKESLVHITFSTKKQWIEQLIFFGLIYAALYFALNYLKQNFYPGAIPWADAFASATAFTGMWLMTRKKVESWIWWIATDFASIPLYFVKQYVFTSVYYLVLLLLAFYGLKEWREKATAQSAKSNH